MPTTTPRAQGSVIFRYTPAQDVDVNDASVDVQASIAGTTGSATLTITDDDVSQGKITVTVSPDEIRENIRARDVTVTATLPTGKTGPLTVMISTAVTGSDPGNTPEPSDMIEIVAGESSGMVVLSLDPADDDVFTTRTIEVTGSAASAGYEDGMAVIKVLDDDDSLGNDHGYFLSAQCDTGWWCSDPLLDSEGRVGR